MICKNVLVVAVFKTSFNDIIELLNDVVQVCRYWHDHENIMQIDQ